MKNSSAILLIGLGNPILGDDGVGWQIVKNIEEIYVDSDAQLSGLDIVIDYLSLGGLSLMERMDGYNDVIVVDAIQTGVNPIGTIYSLPLSQLPNYSTGHSTAIHDTSLATALEVGRKMGMILPEDVWVFGIEAENVYEFSETLTPEIESVIPSTVKIIVESLSQGIRQEKIIPPPSDNN